jgi:hypothetical protein
MADEKTGGKKAFKLESSSESSEESSSLSPSPSRSSKIQQGYYRTVDKQQLPQKKSSSLIPLKKPMMAPKAKPLAETRP